MKIENFKSVLQKNRKIFYWLPSLYTILFPEGYAIIFCWGFYSITLRDTEIDYIIPTRK